MMEKSLQNRSERKKKKEEIYIKQKFKKKKE